MMFPLKPFKTSIYAGFAMATFDYKPPAGHGRFGDIHTFLHVRLGFLTFWRRNNTALPKLLPTPHRAPQVVWGSNHPIGKYRKNTSKNIIGHQA